MGHGIALELARCHVQVLLWDESPEARASAVARVADSAAAMESARMAEPGTVARVARGVGVAASLDGAVADAQLVVEAVSEDLALKQQLFHTLGSITEPTAILASNTSSFMPSTLVAQMPVQAKPERVLVAHHFNPPHLLPAVELVPHAGTAPEVVDAMSAFFRAIGKRPVILRREVQGFVANRLQQALLREATSLVELGVVEPAELDALVTGSFGRRLAVAGPFEISDLAGLDVIDAIAGEVWPTLATPGEVAASLHGRAVRGELGAKSGGGFRDWDRETVADAKRRIAAVLAAIADLEGGAADP